MPTVKTQGLGVSGRKEAGDAVLAAAAEADTKKVKLRLGDFAKAHYAYVAAMEKVSAAEAKRDAALRLVGDADAEQDACVEPLVRGLIADGASRTSPLKGLSKHSPSDLVALAVEKEASELQKIAKTLLVRPKLSPELKRLAKAANDAANALLKTRAAVAPHEKRYQDALNARDSLGLPWETSLAYLKRAVRVAEDEGAKGLFEALFQRTAVAPRAKKPRAKKTPAE